MGKPLRVLMVEDSEDDILLTIRELKKGGYDPVHERVEDAEAMRKALRKKTWDVILCDYKMPQFNGFAAIALLKETAIDIPLIIVSGAIGEETAVECMRLGAHDYVMKGNLSRLVPAIERELKEAESRSQRKRAEEALKESETKYSELAHFLPQIVFETDMKGNITFVNHAAYTISGYSPEEVKRGLNVLQLLVPKDRDRAILNIQRILHGEELRGSEYTFLRKDGHTFPIITESVPIVQNNQILGLRGLVIDITERKRAEEMLRGSEEKYREIFESITDVFYRTDNEGLLCIVSPSVEKLWGYVPNEVIGKKLDEFYINPEERDQFLSVLREKGEVRGFEAALRAKDGSVVFVSTHAQFYRDIQGNILGVQGISRDITERRRMEAELQKSEANYRQLFDNAPAGIYQVNFRTGKFIKANDFICEYLGCSREEITSLSPYDLMTKESQKLLIERLNKMATGDKVPDDPEYEIVNRNGERRWLKLNVKTIYDPEGLAGADVVAHDITERKRMEIALQESEALFRSYLENAPDGIYMSDLEGKFLYGNRKCEEIVGYKREELIGKNFLELNILSKNSLDKAIQVLQANSEGKSTGPDEVELISKEGCRIPLEVNTSAVQHMGQRISLSFVRDITERKIAVNKLQDTLENLRRAVNATIQVMVSAVEVRDPYTSGHQTRSADLARAIATELGLSQEKIEGIRMAGSVHDIGKLSIPAEILSKPAKLTQIELSLIKEHAHMGFDMLKNVESPWPLAEIVYQHHERMDGSGYPRNLKGEEICIEARILAVADVVEAMASHRPYRPGLGIDAALNEIEKNRGIFYDDAVIDACLRLFREKGFKLATA